MVRKDNEGFGLVLIDKSCENESENEINWLEGGLLIWILGVHITFLALPPP